MTAPVPSAVTNTVTVVTGLNPGHHRIRDKQAASAATNREDPTMSEMAST